jgi:hypothetical protein
MVPLPAAELLDDSVVHRKMSPVGKSDSLERALSTPPKPHETMGRKSKERPASKGRVAGCRVSEGAA